MVTKRTTKMMVFGGLAILAASVALLYLYNVSLQPFRVVGGVAWFKHGIHYISSTEISTRVENINAPKEAALAQKVKISTASCDAPVEGFCQKATGVYELKTMTKPAVAYSPGTPDRKEVVGFCTACNDGTLSPSCATGSGACSWHNGVAAYNVPQYRIIPGIPAIEAQPAVYSYTSKVYKDSPIYVAPETPSLNMITGY